MCLYRYIYVCVCVCVCVGLQVHLKMAIKSRNMYCSYWIIKSGCVGGHIYLIEHASLLQHQNLYLYEVCQFLFFRVDDSSEWILITFLLPVWIYFVSHRKLINVFANNNDFPNLDTPPKFYLIRSYLTFHSLLSSKFHFHKIQWGQSRT
jgi:hypothetical protein